MKIPILNIYYLLCYAWNRLDEGETISVSQVEKDEVSQLFATVLIEGTSHLFKKGLDRGYVQYSDEIQRIRGRIDFPMNIKRTFFKQPRLYCDFDELDYNVLHNQILKITIKNMINCEGIDDDANYRLKTLYLRLQDVDDICLTKKCFRQVQLHRNNFFYDFLIKVCELIFDNLLISKKGEGGKFKDFVQNETIMSRIFEEFVRNFYKRHLDSYKVSRSYISWKLRPLSDRAGDFLPRMETDITLLSENKKIIMDTKYYKETLSQNDKIHSGNLYQLYAYLKNQEETDDPLTMICEGILLYPTIDAGFRHDYQENGHKICIRTINLNQEWKRIESDLLSMIN